MDYSAKALELIQGEAHTGTATEQNEETGKCYSIIMTLNIGHQRPFHPMPEAKAWIDDNTNFAVLQLFTPCLAEMAYLVSSDGEAAIIDPLREIDVYLELLQERGLKLKYIFETHFHADFVSGHYDLSMKTGATIVFGPNAQANYDIKVAQDDEIFNLGKVSIKVLHTPGHTMESSSFLLLDGQRQHCLFTGDTLFLGEVGRPDLAVKNDETTSEDLAGFLFDSLRNKIMKLDPLMLIYPGHGAGSACGKKISEGTYCSLGKQLLNNYALQDMTREAFIKELTTGITPPPQYFFHDVAQNKNKITPVDVVLKKSLKFLASPNFEEFERNGVVILDTRSPKEFECGFIHGAISLPLTMNFAVWGGTLFIPTTKFFIISEAGKEKESVIRLARIGYDNCIGALDGGMDAYRASGLPLETINHVAAAELIPTMMIFDVRNPSELLQGKIDGAINVPLDKMTSLLREGKLGEKFPLGETFYIHCKTGGRSTIACSILRKGGYTTQVNIDGGYDAIKTDNKLIKIIV